MSTEIVKHDLTHLHLLTVFPPCVADSCESGPSRRCSHIPVIVHSRTGRLCSSATSHHTQPGRAASARPWGRWHRPGHSLPTRQGDRRWQLFTSSSGSSRCFLNLTGARDEEEEEEEEERGLFSVALGVLFVEEAGRSVGNERRQLAGSAEVNS